MKNRHRDPEENVALEGIKPVFYLELECMYRFFLRVEQISIGKKTFFTKGRLEENVEGSITRRRHKLRF